VCAVNSHGEGPRTSVASCVPLGLPEPPRMLTGRAGDGSVELAWSPPEEDGGSRVLGYRLFQGETPDAENLVAELPADGTDYKVAGLTNGVTYRFWLAAFTSVGQGSAAGPITAVPLGPPGPPMGLTATRGDSNVTLEWRPPADDGGSAVTGYVLYRGDSSGEMRVLALLGPALTYLDIGLFNGRTYNYSVAAVNLVGNGTPSSMVRCTPAGIPGRPLAVTATAEGRSVLLSWDPPWDDGGSAIVSYVIMRGTGPDDITRIANVTGALNYTDTSVARGETYVYRVVAINEVGEGAASDAATVDVRKASSDSPGPTAVLAILMLLATWIRMKSKIHTALEERSNPVP
jgi:hypothetical protein